MPRLDENVKLYSHCRLCNKPLLLVLDLGESAPANAYIDPKNPHVNDKYELRLCVCSNCGCTQLDRTVKGELLFKNYRYSSSTIPSLVKHFELYAQSLSLPNGAKVLEIGSNDGVLLKPLKERGFNVLGVEPSTNLAEQANSQSLTTLCNFFNESVAEQILLQHGQFDCITSNNCFAHIDDIHSVMKGIKKLLKHTGFFVFENAYLLNTVEGLYFDQSYSEHIFYHSIKPLSLLMEQYEMEIYDVQFNKNQGGSIRVFVKSIGNKRQIQPVVKEAIRKEEESGIYYNAFIYQKMLEQLQTLSNHLHSFINKEQAKGKTFSAYGAAAKFTTFANFFKLYDKIQYVVDDSPLKWGLIVPEGKVPIISPEEFKTKKTDYCIITAWNFAEAIAKSNSWYKEAGGKFITAMPELHIF